MQKKYHKIHLRMSEREYNSLKQQAEDKHMTMNKFMMKRLEATRPFFFPVEKVTELANFTNERGKRINEIARAFNAGFGSEAMLVEANALLIEIKERTAIVCREKQALAAEWRKETGYTKHRKYRAINEKDTHGLMLRLTDAQYTLLQKFLKITRYTQTLFLRRLIDRYPIDGNNLELVDAYEGYAPYNRIHNNVMQILCKAEKMNIPNEEISIMEFLLKYIGKDANRLLEFV